MTEDKPIAKPIIDDATREKMALMFSGEVYLPDDVDGFFDLQAAQRDLQLELNATPLTNPKRRTELMQAFFGAAGLPRVRRIRRSPRDSIPHRQRREPPEPCGGRKEDARQGAACEPYVLKNDGWSLVSLPAQVNVWSRFGRPAIAK